MISYPLLKEVIRLLRSWFLKVRLKVAGHIFEILCFEEIEKRYIGRALSYQVHNWRTLFSDGGIIYSYWETNELNQLRRIISEPARKIFLANEAGVFSDRGIVYNNYYNCAVLETIELWGSDTNTWGKIRLIKKQPSRTLRGMTLSLLTLGADSNYAHFLFDGMSRLALSKSLGFEPDWYLVSGPERDWKKKILLHLNILDKVVWVNAEDELQCEQLLFIPRLNYSRHVTPFVAKAVRNLFVGAANHSGERRRLIYASRKNSKIRPTELENRINKLLPAMVEVIEFETLTMAETIHICSECVLFFGIHGAAFSNIIFCLPQTRIVEFQIADLLHEVNRNYFQTISETLGFEHRIVMTFEAMPDSELSQEIESILKV